MERQTPDLLFQEEIRELVREAYRELPRGAGRPVVERFYGPEALSRLPEESIRWALGVGDPVGASDVRAGETVLDVGCGAGIDSILAADRVGATGAVIGLDLLPEMCARAESAAAAAGTAGWSTFRVGVMEAIPLPDDTVDVIVTNGVLNLSPRRSRALAEMARVLRPGGRLWAADLTVDDELPPAVLGSEAAWAGCIAGAVSTDVLRRKLLRAGFGEVTIEDPEPFGLADVALYPLFPPDVLDLLREALPAHAQQQVAIAHLIRARLRPDPDVEEDGGARGTLTPSGVRSIADIPIEEVEAPGVTVRHLAGVEDADLKVLDVEPGGATPHHRHLHAHEGIIVAGIGHLRLDGGPRPLRPGLVFHVNPNDPHAIVNDGDQPLRLLCMDCLHE